MRKTKYMVIAFFICSSFAFGFFSARYYNNLKNSVKQIIPWDDTTKNNFPKEVNEVSIPSTIDGINQMAMFYISTKNEAQPLLLVCILGLQIINKKMLL